MKDSKKYIEWFRIMWNRIADKQEKEIYVEKRYVIEEMYREGIIDIVRVFHMCFLCEYAGMDTNGYPNCHNCPVDWGSSADRYMCERKDEYENKGIYGKWIVYTEERYLKEAAKVARKIANLPERKEN